MNDNAFDLHRDAIRQAAVDPVGIAARMSFAEFTADTFKGLGEKLFVCGHILGTDRRDGVSPFGHGDDAVVAISMLLRIGSELISGCADLVVGKVRCGQCVIIPGQDFGVATGQDVVAHTEQGIAG